MGYGTKEQWEKTKFLRTSKVFEKKEIPELANMFKELEEKCCNTQLKDIMDGLEIAVEDRTSKMGDVLKALAEIEGEKEIKAFFS